MPSRLGKGLFYLLFLPAAIAFSGWQGWSWWSWATDPVELAASAETSPDVPSAPNAPDTIAAAVQIEIPIGTSSQQIGQDLEAAGLIRSSTAWNLWTRWQLFQQPEAGYQAGTYLLSPTQSLQDIAAVLASGDVVTRSFTVPEGWNREQIAAALAEAGFFTAEEFLRQTEIIPTEQYLWLPENLPHLEGFLFPDTYQIAVEQITPAAVVAMMLDRFEKTALPLYQQAPETDLLDWVTLASIVEKEAVVAEERSTIAGVFDNRLRESIPLGADPTVEYGLGISQTPENPLTLSQVQTPNPYNTYLNVGLPPTPISNPGLASLEASLNPAETDFLYFVARYDGTHVFSRTLQEHEAAQAKIRDEIDQVISPSGN
ncbi:MAG: endolytic transglycosylase MltG [Leptolyngbyaceae cyanobacterium SL_1_1]|nr:endolytic transglycosylase MltG [Leptolyngbyaceae cyanobacterium RM1_1_2]NJO09500.1 endolytic transglycosylase MltG [Leptolyngbyaceae cyanobacterium SL_1_1]